MEWAGFKNFEEAGKAILHFLHQRFGFELWMITRVDDEHQIVLQSEDHGYGIKAGQAFCWADTFCRHMVEGNTPKIAPRSEEIPLYVEVANKHQMNIKAYIGQPLVNTDGSVFGTLCAIDPQPKPDVLLQEHDLIELMGDLLSCILQAELRQVEHRRQSERLQAEALSDELTGLYNRRGWDRLIEAEEERCRRYGHSAAVFIIDLNGLKNINDTQGHAAGDELIKRAANALKHAGRKNDVVARLGGDEFGVLSIENNMSGAKIMFNQIEQDFAEANVSAAIGIAVRSSDSTLQEACKQADQQMYFHKHKRHT